jgi:hypothetical protein
MNDDQLSRVRGICLSLPEAVEQEAWGEPTFRVRKKIFAMFASSTNHHGRGVESLWCNAPTGIQELLVRTDPDIYFAPPYVGPKGWIGIRLQAVDSAVLRDLVVQSYCMIAPKKLQALLPAGESA